MANQMTVNDTQLFYKQTGAFGEPLILVHGSWVDHHTWDAVVPALSQSFQVLTYDRRGHSQSERHPDRDSINDDVHDLARLIEEQGFAPAHISGSSFGGSIVLRLAAERPDLFRSLHVHEPPLLGLLAQDAEHEATLEAINARFRELERLLASGEMEGGARHFVETILYGPGAWAEIPPEMKETLIYNAPTFLNEIHDPAAFTIDLEDLRTFAHPALLTISEHGLSFMPPILEQLVAVIPHATRVTLTDADHEPENSNPEMYVHTLRRFIAGIRNDR